VAHRGHSWYRCLALWVRSWLFVVAGLGAAVINYQSPNRKFGNPHFAPAPYWTLYTTLILGAFPYMT